ncbi:hypothetical protein MRX96_046743 [Rhipicephalus microplus]
MHCNERGISDRQANPLCPECLSFLGERRNSCHQRALRAKRERLRDRAEDEDPATVFLCPCLSLGAAVYDEAGVSAAHQRIAPGVNAVRGMRLVSTAGGRASFVFITLYEKRCVTGVETLEKEGTM